VRALLRSYCLTPHTLADSGEQLVGYIGMSLLAVLSVITYLYLSIYLSIIIIIIIL
jgi:hypothetical protein